MLGDNFSYIMFGTTVSPIRNEEPRIHLTSTFHVSVGILYTLYEELQSEGAEVIEQELMEILLRRVNAWG